MLSSLDFGVLTHLWKHDQKALLEELLEKEFNVIISGIFAYPLDEKWLGKQIDTKIIERLVELQAKIWVEPFRRRWRN